MIEYGALPPEINSGRMYAGPGPSSLLASMAAWQALTVELGVAGESFNATISLLATGPWLGPSALAMAAAAQPFVAWIEMQTVQAQMAALAAGNSAEAHSTAFAAHVPPPAIEANRDALMAAIGGLPWTAPVVAALEAEYQEMWAQDAAAMYAYSAQTTLIINELEENPFLPPGPTTNPAGLAEQAAMAGQDAGQGTVGSTVSSASDQVSGMGSQLGGLASVAQAPMSAAMQLPQTLGQLPQALSGVMGSLGGFSGMNGADQAAAMSPSMFSAARFMPMSGVGGGAPVGGVGSPVTAMMGNSGRLGGLSAPRLSMAQAGWTTEETGSIRTLSVTPGAAAPATETTTAAGGTPRTPLIPAVAGGSPNGVGGARTVLPRASATKRMVF